MKSTDIATLVEEEVRTEIFYPKIDSMKSGMIVEVGTFLGGNIARVLAYSKKYIDFYCVDNFKFDNISSQSWKSVNQTASSKMDVWNSLRECEDIGILPNLIEADSVEAAQKFPYNSIDLLFLDANHGYGEFKQELIAWTPKVKFDGIISGHDYPEEGIRKAVKEIFPHTTIKETSTKGAFYLINPFPAYGA